jgi:acyl-CoA thioester hydrolase
MIKALAEITVRFSDCDPMGHTNNAVYFSYMEQARVALFKTIIPLQRGMVKTDQYPFIIAEISCRFLKPTYMEDIIEIEAGITKIKNSSFLLSYEMKCKGKEELVATGKSVQVWYDYCSGKSMPIPDHFRKLLEN